MVKTRREKSAEQGQLKLIDRRAVKEYFKAAKDLDNKYHHTSDDEIGPVKSALLSFGPVAGKYEGAVLGLGIGCFGELPAGFNDVYTFIARSRAVSYVDRRVEAAVSSLEQGRDTWNHR